MEDEKIKNEEIEEKGPYINEYGEIIRPENMKIETLSDVNSIDESKEEKVEKTPLQKREEELSSLEAKLEEFTNELKDIETKEQDLGGN